MKILRKIGKICIWGFVGLIGLLLILYLIFQSSRVQTYLTGKIVGFINSEYNIELKVDHIDISLFKSVILEGIYLEDEKKDTLCFIESLRVQLGKVKIMKKYVDLSHVQISGMTANYISDSLSSNIAFLIDAFSNKDTVKTPDTKPGWDINLSSFSINNSTFRYKELPIDPVSDAVNFTDIELQDLNLAIGDLLLKDTISFSIQELSFIEKSGLHLKQLSAFAFISQHDIVLKHLKLITGKSELYASDFNFQFESTKDLSEFTRKVELDIEFISPSYLNADDLIKFIPNIVQLNQQYKITAQINGTIHDLTVKDLQLDFGDESHINANASINGLPDINNTYFLLNLKSLQTRKQELELFLNSFQSTEKEAAELPDNISSMGMINCKGVFSGKLNDFIARGEASTEIGGLQFYVKINPDKKKRETLLSGKIELDKFHMGKFLDNPDFGQLTLEMNCNGKSPFEKQRVIDFDGNIRQCELYDYNYHNIYLEGGLINSLLAVFIDLNDPNIRFSMNGKADFSQQDLKLSTNINVLFANLNRLKIDTGEYGSYIKFKCNTLTSGTDINNILGKVSVSDMYYKKADKSFSFQNFELYIDTIQSSKQIKLESDFFDANLFGTIYFTTLPNCLNHFIETFLPAIIKYEEYKRLDFSKQSSVNAFNFDIHLRDINPITDFFYPDLQSKSGIEIKGLFDSRDNEIDLQLNSDNITVHGVDWDALSIYAGNLNDKIVFEVNSALLSISGDTKLPNFTFYNIFRNDSIYSKIIWGKDKKVSEFLSEIPLLTIFDRNDSTKNIQASVKFLPTEININNDIWKISNSSIFIDSSYVSLDRFTFQHDEQSLLMNGAVSEFPDDTISLEVHDFELAMLNPLLSQTGFTLDGKINGAVKVSNVYSNPEISSTCLVSDLLFNNYKLGHLNMYLEWNDDKDYVDIRSYLYKGRINTLDIGGTYKPATDSMNIDVKINNFLINPFAGLIEEDISGLKGIISSDSLTISGTTASPDINGRIKIQKGNAFVNYLQTRYSFTDSIDISKNALQFNRFKINDYRNDSMFVSGKIKHDNFSDMHMDLNVEANNFQFLNTTEDDNELYYGEAFASGLVSVDGPVNTIHIGVNAKSEKGTNIFIPLYNSSEVNEYNFISFVNADTVQSIVPEELYEVDLSGLAMDFNLEVTPDAEIQIILDPTVGDIIRAKGSGNLEMKIDTKGDFQMKGEYIIEKGDYLFTLQNVINKKFHIENGSSIIWSGDPYNAKIDISAVYHIRKVSLYDLLLDENYKELKIPVNCVIHMKGKLMEPLVQFDIKIPEEEEDFVNPLKNLPPDELNKQFLSLLVINRFQPPTDTKSSSKAANAGFASNASEVLTNQLSRWLSQISDDFDIGLKYRSASDSISKAEIEVALSTQLLNDRVRINSNVNYGGEQSQEDEFIGEFEIEYKITKSGRFRIKYFTKQEKSIIYDNPYKQGVGLFYKKEFNSIKDIFKSDKKDKTESKKPEKHQQKQQQEN